MKRLLHLVVGIIIGMFIMIIIQIFRRPESSQQDFEKWWSTLPDDWCEDIAKEIASRAWHDSRTFETTS